MFRPVAVHAWQTFHGREPFCRREWCKVFKMDGCIVSRVCWVARRMSIGSATIRASAIGYSSTHPAYRGIGLARALMETWTRELSARGTHLSLVTGIAGFCEQLG